MTSTIPRRVAIAILVTLTTGLTSAPWVSAVVPPLVDPSHVPPDGVPGPERPMRQSNLCARPIAAHNPEISERTASFVMLNVAQAWKYSTGNGVRVAVIDTGITPHPRLPVLPGGDYVSGGDGLSDCDAHGTVVASVIAAAPRGAAMPPPMPPISSSPRHEDLAFPDTAAEGSPGDGVVGVAPHATLISIRQSSRAFEPVYLGSGDMEAGRKAGSLVTLARAVVHAANLGAKVINVSVAACVSAADPLDQQSIGAAVWYAATVKDAVVIAAAGNEGEDGCVGNPVSVSPDPQDPRGWGRVTTVSSPSWFTDYVLSVGAVDPSGAPIAKSLAGPWVGVAAPGVGIIGLSPQTGAAVNAYPASRPGEKDAPFWGTSFAAAYVSGVAALVRAKFPDLSAQQVISRLKETAHNPPNGTDNQVGYGVVDPVAALTFNVRRAPLVGAGKQTRLVSPPTAPPTADHRARTFAFIFTGAVLAGMAFAAVIGRSRRQR